MRTILSETVSPCRRPPGGPHHLHLPARPNQYLEWYRPHRFGVRQNGCDTIGMPLHEPWSICELNYLEWLLIPVLSCGPLLIRNLKAYLVVSGYINRLADAFQPWSVFSIPMAADWRHPRLVQCYPHLDLFKKRFSLLYPVTSSWFKSNLIAEFPEAHSGILFEPKSDVWIEPSAAVLQGLGEIPVVESDCGRDTLSFQSRDQILVVLDGN